MYLREKEKGGVRGGDGASADVPIPPRDASDGRVSGLVLGKESSAICML